MLRVEDVTVRFGGVQALNTVSLEISGGHITGLIGPNGAGKTTLFNVITGLQKPTQGRVYLDGHDVTEVGPRGRSALGLGRTFQRLELFGSLSAHDNVLVVFESHGIRGRKGRHATMEMLERVGLSAVAKTTANLLPTGLARLLELARALACDPKVLLLDEPSSGLDPRESERFAELLENLVAGGVAILLVEHDMDLIMNLCSEIHVLDFGQLIACGEAASIQADPAVQAAYLGSPTSVESTS
jgi:branched-chain amino acid transport system ATP-binding protein